MKTASIFSILILTVFTSFGQKNYSFGPRNGVLDSSFVNPLSDDINSKAHCVKYERKTNAKYDNIKIYPKSKLVDVSPYASYVGIPPKITMKVYTSAPVGTKIELQLGKMDDFSFPSGVHSQYEAVTTVQNKWEVITFIFAQIPPGSLVASTEVDQVTLLFAPNTSRSDIYYFDDLSFPALISGTKTEPVEKK